jgi:hypothetical protein
MLSRIIILLLWSTLIIACRKFVWDNPNDGINQDKEPASLKDGLLAYYPFNANANDESGNGNNGSVNGATLVTDRFNKINSAYTFDGIDDWIAINGSSSFNSQNISLSIWIDNSVPFSVNNQFLVCGSSTIAPWAFGFDVAGNLGVYKNQGCGQFVNNSFSKRSEQSKWNNYVIIFSGTQCILYVNGMLIETIQSSSINGACTTNALNIGRDVYLQSEYFKGSLDDVRIYNRGLTQTEITYLATH